MERQAQLVVTSCLLTGLHSPFFLPPRCCCFVLCKKMGSAITGAARAIHMVELDAASLNGAACVMQQQSTLVALAVPIPLLSLAR
jgi:hypothetical protein